MANGDTKTNQYLDVAANGTRADLPSDTCCETRTQTLIRGVAERIMDVEDEVEELKNNPDVVDIVDTYADLQNYPTSGLTDKDVVRVITDETKGGLSSYYRWNSPNPGWNFVGVIPGGDGIKELSSADYNYPTENPDRVALWLLDNGVYTAPAGVMVAASTTSYPWYNTSDKTILVGGSDTVKGIYTFLNGKTDVVTTQVSDGTEADEYTLLKSNQVLQTTGQSTTDTMSQKAITDAIAGGGGGTTYTAGDGIDITNDIISATNTGKAKVLTTSDYNYPANNPDGVALWTLDSGIYTLTSGSNVKVYYNGQGDTATTGTFVIAKMSTYVRIRNIHNQDFHSTTISSGNRYADNNSLLTYSDILDNLISTSTADALSANQGKVLNDKIGGDLSNLTTTDKTSLINAINEVAGQGGSGITELTSADYNYPTNNPTSVALWKLNSGAYMWGNVEVKSSSSTDVSSDHFAIVGEKQTGGGIVDIISLGDGSSQVSGNYNLINTYTVEYSNGNLLNSKYALTRDNVVQSTGTSTSSVMSQNAITSMVFADPSTKNRIRIGSSVSAGGTNAVSIGTGANVSDFGDYGLALGSQTRANAQYSVAVGSGASATTKGQFDIGTSQSSATGGYNDSAYRLLTGLYDGQSAHDAVNLEQLQKAIINGGTTAPTTATVGAVGTLYSYVDTTGTPTPHMMVCTEADTVTPSYTWQTLV